MHPAAQLSLRLANRLSGMLWDIAEKPPVFVEVIWTEIRSVRLSALREGR
jgi:undecaprenyl pyrophosphate synthase